ncbi:hypothetical protein L6R52_03945 [Myxococcota bacterium]|nr:hypothetical protein [Myxococcota bacterium]
MLFAAPITVVSRDDPSIETPALPICVLMMQQDVINALHHARTHYLTIPLSEPFLQNSSLGSPYNKWSYFTNADFAVLAETVTALAKYTHRLIAEQYTPARTPQNREARLVLSNSRAMCEAASKERIGLRVLHTHTIEVTRFIAAEAGPDSDQHTKRDEVSIIDRGHLIRAENQLASEELEITETNLLFRSACELLYATKLSPLSMPTTKTV